MTIDLAILGLLAECELHGYELSKRLADLLELGAPVSFGSVYPALGRLERAGQVKAVEAGRIRLVPMTGSLAGELAAARGRLTNPGGRRAKKVYGITDKGEQRLVELLLDPGGVATAAGFGLRLSLFRYLSPAQRRAVIVARRSTLTHLQAEADRLGPWVDRWSTARRAHEAAVIAEDLRWLDELEQVDEHPDHTQSTTGQAPAEPATSGVNE